VPLKREWLLRILNFVYIVTVIDNGHMNVVFFLLISNKPVSVHLQVTAFQ